MAKKKSDKESAPKKRAKKSVASSKAKSKAKAAKPRATKPKKSDKLEIKITRWDKSPYEDESLAEDSAVSKRTEVSTDAVPEAPSEVAEHDSLEALDLPPVKPKKASVVVTSSDDTDDSARIPAQSSVKNPTKNTISVTDSSVAESVTVSIGEPQIDEKLDAKPESTTISVVQEESDVVAPAEPELGKSTVITVSSEDRAEAITVHHDAKEATEPKPARIIVSDADIEESESITVHTTTPKEEPPIEEVPTPAVPVRIKPAVPKPQPIVPPLTSTPVEPEPIEQKHDSDLEAMLSEMQPAESEPVRQQPTEPQQPAKTEPIPQPKPRKEPLLQRLKKSVRSWWSQPRHKVALAGVAGVLLIVTGALPVTRYRLLNTVGMRTNASIEIVDSQTGQPLKGVEVKVANVSTTTDERGWAELREIPYGAQKVAIRKGAYKERIATLTIGHGNNQFNDLKIESSGIRRTLQISDWLSGKPIAGALAEYGEYNARSNDAGEATVTLPADTPANGVVINIKADGYASSDVQLISDAGVQSVTMVIGQPHYYVAKSEDSVYNVYKVNADGSNSALLLQGTGDEEDDIAFDVAPSGKWGVLSAARDAASVNSDGYVLRGLFVVEMGSDQLKKIDESERIDLVDWVGDTIIYVKVQAGASGRDPERYRLMSYDLTSSKQMQLATSNYFNDVLVADGYVFYAPSDAYKDNPAPYLFRVKADGTDQATILKRNVWNIVRTGYDSLVFDAEQTWYSGTVESLDYAKLGERPESIITKLYAKSPSGKQAAWVDFAKDEDSLYVYDVETKQDRLVLKQAGMRYPVRWLDESHLVFRVMTETEQADYIVAVSEDNPKPQKITDVAGVKGVDGWYYYY